MHQGLRQRRPDLAVVTRGRVSQRTVLLVASSGAFLAFLDATIVNVAFTSIQSSFPDAGIGALSWVLNAYNIVFAAFLVVCGRLADLLGRRSLLVTGLLVFTGASLLCALAGSVEMLVAFRVLQALGAALLVPASLAVVVEAFPPERRPHAIGLWGAAAAVAAGLGPPIGGVLVELGDWRWAFAVNVPIGVVALLTARRLLVESRAPGRRRLPDLPGAAAFATALGLLTLAIVQSETWGWVDARTATALVGAAAFAAAFVMSSRRHPSPLLDATLLRLRPFAVGNVLTLVAGMGFYAYLLTNVLWLQLVWGWSVLEAGLALVPGALVAAVVAARLGPVAARRGYPVVLVPGALVWVAAFLWYALVLDPEPDLLTGWLPGQLLSGVGAGIVLPITASAALAVVPGGRYATASAFVSSTRQTGAALGIAVLVLVLGTLAPDTAEGALREGWLFAAGCFAACAVLAALIGARRGPDRATVDGGTIDDGHTVDAGRLSLPVAAGSPAGAPDADGDADDLGAVPLLARLPRATRQALTGSATTVVVQAGEQLFAAGDPADSMYLLRAGRLEVVIDDEVVRHLGPGAVLGELALLTGDPRSATVRARRDSELLQVSREVFRSVVTADPAAAVVLSTGLAEQLQQARPTSGPDDSQPTVVAVVGLHPGAPVEAVAADLSSRLRQWVVVAEPGRVDHEQLERAERDADRVVLVAPHPGVAARADGPTRPRNGRGPDGDPGVDRLDDATWWHFCLRQSDRTVLVSDAAAVPTPGSEPPPHAGGAELVLVGRPDRSRAAAWVGLVQPWQLSTVEAIGGGDPAGERTGALRPLAARLAGRSVGVVLAGGGARALAHIGVLAELEDAGVVVDRVAGCSVGSVVGALYAAGHDAAAVGEICYEEFVRRRPFSDYGLPLASLARGRRARRAMERRLDDLLIEELPRQFRCVSTDLHERTRVVHRSGRVVDAVMASFALPVLLPPVRLGGRLLVDGGILDNLPVSTLTERREGPVVAINISMGGGGPRRPGAGGGTEVPRPPRPPRTPALGETLLRTMMIGSGGANALARELGAVVVTPPTLGVGLLEFHQMDVMVQAGRQAGRTLLDSVGAELAAGTLPDGATVDRSSGDGATVDGAPGDGATADGATGDGATGDGATAPLTREDVRTGQA